MNNVITKAELIANLRQEDSNLSGPVAMQLTDAFFEAIIHALETGDSVKLSGLGSFRVRNKKARPGRNPKTGVGATISSRNVVLFQPSQKLKNKLKNAAVLGSTVKQ